MGALDQGTYFFVSVHLFHCKRWSLRYSPEWVNPLCCIVVTYVGEGSEREQCCFLGSCPTFSHFPCYPQANWAFLVLIPRWVVLRMCSRIRESFQWTVRLGVSSTATTLTDFYSQKFWDFLFPCWNPGLLGLSLSPVAPPGLPAHKCGTPSMPLYHTSSPPGCPSLPLLPVWMNVSSLTPLLSDSIFWHF